MVDQPSPNENAGGAAPVTGAALAGTALADTKVANATSATQTGAKPSKSDKPGADKPGAASAAEKKTAANVADPGLDDRVGRLDWMTVVPSWLVSLIFHMSLLFLLAMFVEPAKLVKHVVDLVATDAEVGHNLDQIVTADLPPGATELGQTEGLADAITMSPDADGTDISTLNELPAAPGGPADVSEIGLAVAQVLDLGKALSSGGGGGAGGTAGGQGLEGRGDAVRSGSPWNAAARTPAKMPSAWR